MEKRLEVLKTYKIYIGGQFPRTESGRYFKPTNSNGDLLGNICLSSRKDFRNAVVAARKVQEAWAGKTAYNIGQILYRIAENLEGAKLQFVDLIIKEENVSSEKAKEQVEQAIDRLIYYAGWSDKFQQIFSGVNPVSSSHFNFSILESTGVVACLSENDANFLSLVTAVANVIVGGNTIVIQAGEKAPISAITFAEIINNSDVPGGVVNILTGKPSELMEHFASHMDVNSILYLGSDPKTIRSIKEKSADNLKRVRVWFNNDIQSAKFETPYTIKDFLEVKTTWHPIEQIGGASAGY
jgi:acyl-CoA reductase-like NAD-dependent aldehyde dehydrogenase